jgi:hypothetical protein
MDAILKKCLPTYRIVREIGSGIYGSVYHVRDELKERAVKVVPIQIERSLGCRNATDLDSRVSQDFHAVREYYERIKGDGCGGCPRLSPGGPAGHRSPCERLPGHPYGAVPGQPARLPCAGPFSPGSRAPGLHDGLFGPHPREADGQHAQCLPPVGPQTLQPVDRQPGAAHYRRPGRAETTEQPVNSVQCPVHAQLVGTRVDPAGQPAQHALHDILFRPGVLFHVGGAPALSGHRLFRTGSPHQG